MGEVLTTVVATTLLQLTDGSDVVYALTWTADGDLAFVVTNDAGEMLIAASGEALDDSAWHIVAGGFDGLTAFVTVDGVRVGSATGSAAMAPSDSATLTLGCGDSATASSFFVGQLEEVALFNLTLNDVKDMGPYMSFVVFPLWDTV